MNFLQVVRKSIISTDRNYAVHGKTEVGQTFFILHNPSRWIWILLYVFYFLK